MPSVLTTARESHKSWSSRREGHALHVRNGPAASASGESVGERSRNDASQSTLLESAPISEHSHWQWLKRSIVP